MVEIEKVTLFCPLQDDEINQQSQLAEKLKQQMLDQDEVSLFVYLCIPQTNTKQSQKHMKRLIIRKY